MRDTAVRHPHIVFHKRRPINRAMPPSFRTSGMHSRTLGSKRCSVVVDEYFVIEKTMAPCGICHTRTRRLPIAQVGCPYEFR